MGTGVLRTLMRVPLTFASSFTDVCRDALGEGRLILAGEDDGPKDGDEDQNTGDLKRKQEPRKQDA